MRFGANLPILVSALICLTCGFEAKQNAAQTFAGITQYQALTLAGGALAEQGFDVEEFKPRAGQLTTAWLDSPRKSIRYEISAVPKRQWDGIQPPTAVTVTVKAMARDRLIKGWSPEYPIASRASDLLDDIADLASDQTVKSRPRRPRPACRRSDDCPDGKHCVSGLCFSECTSDNMCNSDEKCDSRGRCIPAAPLPVSEPSASEATEPKTSESVADAGPGKEVAK
ncbi:MAG: hypothetical protein GY845_02120 [Planctomycetes bacterium]|nr:hypothetical protein [Planctomycetota bacterium]